MSKQNFKIAFVGLKLGEHNFKFDIDNLFFKNFEKSPLAKAKLEVRVKLDKKSTFMILFFQLDGFVNTVCDRCSDDFDLEVMDDHKIYIKFDDTLSEDGLNEDEDIVYLKRINQVAVRKFLITLQQNLKTRIIYKHLIPDGKH